VHFLDILSDATQPERFFFRASCGELSPYVSVTAGECFG